MPKGRIVGVSRDFENNQLIVSFIFEEDVTGQYEKLKDEEKLTIDFKKYRKKRSLDANSYAWVLMSKIATVLDTSKEEIYEEMLRHYGTLYEDDDGYVVVTMKKTVAIEKLDGHWMPISDNGFFAAYAKIKGSSEYNTKEMSKFIDGIVSECKELEIETMTPDELSELKQKWGVDIG